MPVSVEGETARGFERVRDAVARVCDAQGEGGVAVTAIVDGEPVVDVWAGGIDADTLIHTWSAIKPVVGACLLLLVNRGRASLDDLVRRFWPELRAAQRTDLRVRDPLCHAAGLASVPPPGTAASLLDWERACSGLAAAEPDWEPGAEVGEHALTYGHLVGELVRRIDGRSIGRFLAEELAGPLDLDLCVGVPEGDLGRVADLRGVTAAWWDGLRGQPGALRHRAFGSGVDERLLNGREWRQGEVPAANGHATARSLARFYALLLAGRLPAQIAEVGRNGDDQVLGERVAWTLAGGRVEVGEVGMAGIGGQWACARPADNLAWAFLTTVMGGYDGVEAVERALNACLP